VASRDRIKVSTNLLTSAASETVKYPFPTASTIAPIAAAASSALRTSGSRKTLVLRAHHKATAFLADLDLPGRSQRIPQRGYQVGRNHRADCDGSLEGSAEVGEQPHREKIYTQERLQPGYDADPADCFQCKSAWLHAAKPSPNAELAKSNLKGGE
jgi:hypothetical protein